MAAVPPGCKMAFSWARYDGWETSSSMLWGMPSVAAPLKNVCYFTPMAAVCTGIGAGVALEHAGHGPGAVAVVLEHGAAHTGELPQEGVLRRLAVPGRLGAVGRPEAEVAGEGVVGVVLEMRPVAVRIRVEGTGFEQEDVETLGGELLRHHRSP